jgi:hypothetical protein
MDEHERTVKAARQVEVMMGFYIHLVVFLLVCAGLVVVNWMATPDIWWAQWPFLGWGIGVLGHALCAFGSGPSFITRWRLQKIRELTNAERAPGATSGGSSLAETIGIILLSMLIGCAAGVGYMYMLLQDARESTRSVQASRDALEKTVKERQVQLEQAAAEKSSLEATVKETKDQLRQLQASDQAAEHALKDANDRLKQAQSARDAAERALEEAKKATPQ